MIIKGVEMWIIFMDKILKCHLSKIMNIKK